MPVAVNRLRLLISGNKLYNCMAERITLQETLRNQEQMKERLGVKRLSLFFMRRIA